MRMIGNSLGSLAELDAMIEGLRIRMRYPEVINIENAEEVKIGQTYFVNVITMRKDCPAQGASFPVLGDEHDDKDFIPVFPDSSPHWHVDWRFIPESLYAPLVKLFLSVFGQNAEQLGCPWRGVANGGYDPDARNLELACVIPGHLVVNVQRWPLPCFRQQLRWEAVPEWLPNLEAAYKDKKVCDNVCPHRGISLTGAWEDENGVRVCPGHGLMWNKEGCLVPRTRK
jgi:hypothetical protein